MATKKILTDLDLKGDLSVTGDLTVDGKVTQAGVIDREEWGRIYAASITTIATLVTSDGSALPTGGAYRMTGHISGTGTEQVSVAVFWNENGTWNCNNTFAGGTSSNQIEFLISGGVPKIKTWHANNYDINVTHERLSLNEDTGTDNLRGYFGADSFLKWTESTNALLVPGTVGATNLSGTNTGDQTSSDFTHDDLSGFVANEHLDWTTDRGATNIHANNYTNTNTQLSTESVQDIVGGMVSSNTETNIAVTYDDSSGKLNFVSTDTNTDTNTQRSDEEIRDVVGAIVSGSGATTVTVNDAANTIVISSTDTNTNTQRSDEEIRDVIGTIVSGSGATTVTVNDATNTIVISSTDTNTDTNTQLSTEAVQDIIGGMVAGNTETNIAVTYDDASGKLNFVSTDTNTDTNTTYTAGNGLSLSGTEFRMAGGSIGGSVNLDTYTSSGYYVQGSNANATSGTNWPTANAGILTVVRAEGNTTHITQTYDRYNSDAFYNRSYYAGTWSSWRNLAQDTNTDTNTTYVSSDFTHDSLSGVDANEHLDWTTDRGATNIHSGNYTNTNTQLSTEAVQDIVGAMLTGNTETNITVTYQDGDGTIDFVSTDTNTDTNTTYVSSDFTHDDLGGVDANEHIDWTTDQGATNIHANNYTDTNTQLSSAQITAMGFSTTDNNTFRGIHDTPVNGATTTSISSNWAFDNVKTAVPAGALFTDTVNTFDGAYSSLSGAPTIPSGNSIVDWTTDLGATNIHVNNYQKREISDTPTDTYSHVAISSNWAFDNVKTAVPAGALFTDTNTQLSSAQITAMGFSTTDNNTFRAISSTPTNGATTTSISSDWAFDNVKTAVPAGAVFTDTDTNTVYSHPSYSATNINTSGATIVDIITTNSTGHVTALGTRTLTLADLGYSAPDLTPYVDFTTDETISGAKKFTDTVEGMGGNLHSYGGDVAFDAFQGYGTIRELATDEYVIPFLGSPHIVGQGNTGAGTTNSRAGTSTYIETAQYDFTTNDQIPYGVVWIRRQGKALISLVAKTKDEGASHIASRLKVGYTPTDNYGDQTNTNTLDVNGNIHAVSSVSASSFIKDSGTSSQFLKANGSVDSNTYLTSSSTQSKYLRSDQADSTSGTLSAPKFYVSAVTSASEWAFQARNSSNTADSGLYFAAGHGNIFLRSSSNVFTTRINSSGDSYFNGGDVGIGTETPSTTLELTGIASATTLGLSISNPDGADMHFRKKTGFSNTLEIVNANNDIDIITGTTSRIFIESANGYVGIGTTNPSHQLYVNGDSRIDGTLISSAIGIGTTTPDLKLDIISGTNNGLRISATDTNNNWRDISIRSYTSESEADALPEGVHMFTTNPSGATGNAFSKYGGFVIQCREDGNSSFAVRVGASLAEAFFINHNAAATFSSTVTATNFILSSDKRLKENIKKVDNKHIDVDWKTFEMKSDNSQNRYGVIAQELEEVHPEFVRTDDKGMKSVAYIDLLIAKIAELEARLDKANI